MTGRERLWALVAALCVLPAVAAGAGKVDELSRILLEDSSYKVRLQAALLLGKLGDPGGAPALIKALGDENKTVRAMSAQSLGKLGSSDAVGPLKVLLGKEKDSFVRTQAQKALASLGPGSGGGKPGARIYLTFGPFT